MVTLVDSRVGAEPSACACQLCQYCFTEARDLQEQTRGNITFGPSCHPVRRWHAQEHLKVIRETPPTDWRGSKISLKDLRAAHFTSVVRYQTLKQKIKRATSMAAAMMTRSFLGAGLAKAVPAKVRFNRL